MNTIHKPYENSPGWVKICMPHEVPGSSYGWIGTVVPPSNGKRFGVIVYQTLPDGGPGWITQEPDFDTFDEAERYIVTLWRMGECL